MHHQRLTAFLAVAAICCCGPFAANTIAAPITLDDANAQRILDVGDTSFDMTTGNWLYNGDGNSVQSDVLDVGSYAGNSGQVQPVFVFQMTGIADPAQIVSADFSVTQTPEVNPNETIDFDVELHAIRTASTPTILASDYETSAQLIMSNFDNGFVTDDVSNLVSTDASAATTLGTWLSNNWSDGDYVFLGLKTDPTPHDQGNSFKLLRYGNSSGGWTAASTDAQLTVTIPEPGSLALLSLGVLGLTCFGKRRRS